SLRRGAGAREREPKTHLCGIDSAAHGQHTRLAERSVEELRELGARRRGLARLDERTPAEEAHPIQRRPREPDRKRRRRQTAPVGHCTPELPAERRRVGRELRLLDERERLLRLLEFSDLDLAARDREKLDAG